MPATLKSISGKKATIYVPTDADDPESNKVRIVYRTKAITQARMDRVIAASERKDGTTNEMQFARMTTELFLAYAVEWDLRADENDSDPIPLTYEGLADVPTDFLGEIVEAIQADQRPDPTTKTS